MNGEARQPAALQLLVATTRTRSTWSGLDNNTQLLQVERLVEDATIAGGAAAGSPATPRGDYKDKVYMERLRCMDENHSERTGLTVQGLNSLAARIDLRTANMVSVEPVCAGSMQDVIDCYNNHQLPEENIRCWETVGE
ncbi:Coiled-coil-helix-coiled-coil-helix domain-containing protein 6-like protein [Operophtera brumata]|uniref:Coiled-coil-helix-coiled-coil-helix domain-containing protein 6-like protein n=1 Tax=Operophtera brumata TaxID=104452 RepID=A0A0L7LAT2_OPEBR|nr:Coiled-coil-helix-coiled-coil-helix domain-containing protein 6-like protein [Operophtera brumata]